MTKLIYKLFLLILFLFCSYSQEKKTHDEPFLFKGKLHAIFDLSPGILVGGLQNEPTTEPKQLFTEKNSVKLGLSYFLSEKFALEAKFRFSWISSYKPGYKSLNFFTETGFNIGGIFTLKSWETTNKLSRLSLNFGISTTSLSFSDDLRNAINDGLSEFGLKLNDESAMGLGFYIHIIYKFYRANGFGFGFGSGYSYNAPKFEGATKPLDGQHIPIILTASYAL